VSKAIGSPLGDLVVHPVAITSLALLVLNDRVLKERYGNAITGKLSDVAGIIFFPLLLISLAEVVRKVIRKDSSQLGLPHETGHSFMLQFGPALSLQIQPVRHIQVSCEASHCYTT